MIWGWKQNFGSNGQISEVFNVLFNDWGFPGMSFQVIQPHPINPGYILWVLIFHTRIIIDTIVEEKLIQSALVL
jgi:hypothetical protein